MSVYAHIKPNNDDWAIDCFGNYYWNGDSKHGPGIFPHKELVPGRDEKDVRRTGTYTAWRGPDHGFIYEQGRRCHYKTAAEAARALDKPLDGQL